LKKIRFIAASVFLSLCLIFFLYNLCQTFSSSDLSGIINEAITIGSYGEGIDFINIGDNSNEGINITVISKTKIFENNKRVRNSDFYLYPGVYIEVELYSGKGKEINTAKSINILR